MSFECLTSVVLLRDCDIQKFSEKNCPNLHPEFQSISEVEPSVFGQPAGRRMKWAHKVAYSNGSANKLSL